MVIARDFSPIKARDFAAVAPAIQGPGERSSSLHRLGRSQGEGEGDEKMGEFLWDMGYGWIWGFPES